MDTDYLSEVAITVDDQIGSNIKSIAGWVKVIAIVGFIYGFCIAVAGFFHAVDVAGISNHYSNKRHFVSGSGVLLLYLAGAAIFVALSVYLLRFSRKASGALASNNQQQLTESFISLKQATKIAAILAILSIVLSSLALIGFFVMVSYSRY